MDFLFCLLTYCYPISFPSIALNGMGGTTSESDHLGSSTSYSKGDATWGSIPCSCKGQAKSLTCALRKFRMLLQNQTKKIYELNISLLNPINGTGMSFGTAVSAVSVSGTMWTEEQPGADRASCGPHSLDFSLCSILQWLTFATTALMCVSIRKSVSLTRVHHSFWLWKPLFYISNDGKQKAQPSWLINPHTAPPSNPRLLC